MDANSFDTICRAVGSLLQTKDKALPDFLALSGVSEFLKMRLTEAPLPDEKIDELAELVGDGEVARITTFLRAEFPNFVEDCVDFYFSRSVVRVALGFEVLPRGSEKLTPWAGP